jgi:hypothetical protein
MEYTGTVRIEQVAEGASYRIALDIEFDHDDACLAMEKLSDLVEVSAKPVDILIDLSKNQGMPHGANSVEVLSRPATCSGIRNILVVGRNHSAELVAEMAISISVGANIHRFESEDSALHHLASEQRHFA